MRKYIIGGMAGFILAFSVSAHADVISLIGKTVQGAFPVKLDGKTLQNQAIVVDGTSYLPVRSLGEAIGYKVMFDADMGITLTKRSDADAVNTTPQTDGQTGAQGEPQTAPPVPSAPEPGTDLDSGYKKIPKVVFTLTIDDTTKTIKKSGDFDYINVDGVIYLSIITLSSVYAVTWNDPLISLSLNGQIVTSIATPKEYIKGANAVNYNGTTYVNLAALGLHAVQAGDTLLVNED